MPPLSDEHAVAVIMFDRAGDASLENPVGDLRASLGLRGPPGGGEYRIAIAQGVGAVAVHADGTGRFGDEPGVGEDFEEGCHPLARPAVVPDRMGAATGDHFDHRVRMREHELDRGAEFAGVRLVLRGGAIVGEPSGRGGVRGGAAAGRVISCVVSSPD